MLTPKYRMYVYFSEQYFPNPYPSLTSETRVDSITLAEPCLVTPFPSKEDILILKLEELMPIVRSKPELRTSTRPFWASASGTVLPRLEDSSLACWSLIETM